MDSGPLLPAIGYIRVSTEREEMISPETQRGAIEGRAARDGHYIAKWIEELDESGTDFGRKGVQEAIRDVREGTEIGGVPVRRVYVWKYSRFGRHATRNGVFVEQMEDAGGQLVSATEEVDARTAIGNLTRGMIWQIDEFYARLTGENWKDAHARRRRMGLTHNGGPRFGYLYHSSAITGPCKQGCEPGSCETGYVPDPATRDHAAGMYDAYNEGTSVLKIAVHLNGLGVLTVAGKPWDQVTVRKYMDSGFAVGLLRVHNPKHDHKSRPCKDKVLIPGAHEPIISEETWQEYWRQRGLRKFLPPRVESPVYPLSGLIRCGRCGGPMHAHSMVSRGVKKPGYLYQCSKYMRSRECKGTWIARHRVEDVVLGWLFSFAEDIDKAAAAEKGRARVRKTVDLDRRRLEAAVQKADADLTSLTVKFARDVIPEDAYVKARDELLAGKATAQEALGRLAPPPPDLRPLVEVSVGLVREWRTLPVARRRALLGHMMAHATVFSQGKGHARVEIASTWGQVYVYGI